jgi:hypothetical protein
MINALCIKFWKGDITDRSENHKFLSLMSYIIDRGKQSTGKGSNGREIFLRHDTPLAPDFAQ